MNLISISDLLFLNWLILLVLLGPLGLLMALRGFYQELRQLFPILKDPFFEG